MFLALNGIYEPSAIQQLSDGRFLVAEDEKESPFSLMTLRLDGTATVTPLVIGADAENPGKLDDLEGLAAGPDGVIYAITSHSRNGKGEAKKSRERLLRFRVDGNRLTEPRTHTGLKAALTERHPVLASAAALTDVKGEGGLNIEALEFAADRKGLLIGFRSPLDRGQALVATVTNPAAMFEPDAGPDVAPDLIRLDLEGHGLRGMSWIPSLQGYLLISGPVAREKTQFRLWFWNGRAGSRPVRADVADLPGFEHAEGITPAVIDGRQRIVIVSDDGGRADGRPARFLLLAPEQIRVLP